MYNYYCTFGEQKHTNNDFMSLILNMLRESLEGILTNSEMFYKDVNQLNRQITRPNTIKDSYPIFAELMM